MAIMFVPVLSISAGKDIKAPSGNFLKFCIAGGTLEYVGYVFLIKNAAASSNASSNVLICPVIEFIGTNSVPMSLCHALMSSKFLNACINCDLEYSKPYCFHTLSPPAYSLATLSVGAILINLSNKASELCIVPAFN